MGAKIYSQETPEWKTRNTTRFADSMYIKSSQLAQLLKKYDKYYDELYYSFSEAAKAVSSRSKEADAKIVHDAEQLDTLKAD